MGLGEILIHLLVGHVLPRHWTYQPDHLPFLDTTQIHYRKELMTDLIDQGPGIRIIVINKTRETDTADSIRLF